MKKKIIFCSDNFGIGGIQRVNTVIGQQLSMKYKVSYLSLSGKDDGFDIGQQLIIHKQSLKEKVLNFPFHVKSAFYWHFFNRDLNYDFWSNYNSPNYYKTLYEYDTVILSGSCILFASKIKKVYPLKNVIIWIHNSHDIYFNRYFKNNKKELIDNLRAANKVVVLTDQDKEDFLNYSKKVVKVNNPLTISNEMLNFDTSSKIISVTCRLVIEQKGLDYLVEISKNLPNDWKISIAGTGSNLEVKKLKKLIKTSGVEEKIILRGELEGQELVEHYLNSSIYVMTSRWEGFGLVLLEAMSFGLPIISFDNVGAREVLSNGAFGVLVEQGNIKKFSDKLLDLINDKNSRQMYSHLSDERVKDFSIHEIIKFWEEII